MGKTRLFRSEKAPSTNFKVIKNFGVKIFLKFFLRPHEKIKFFSK